MWKSMAAAAGGLGLIGLARSQYERKALSVETVEIRSDGHTASYRSHQILSAQEAELPGMGEQEDGMEN